MAPAELKPLCLITSDQVFLRDQALARLRARLVEMDVDLDFNAETFDARAADPADIIAAALTLPLGSDFRLVVVSNVEKFEKEALDLLATYAQEPTPSTILCLVGEKLNRSTRLFKAIAANGTVLDRKAPRKSELPGVVRGLLTERGLDFEAAVPEILINLVGEDLGALSGAIATLNAAAAGKKATRKLVAETIGASAAVKNWELTDALSEKKIVEALRVVERSIDQGAKPSDLTGPIAWMLRQLITARSLVDEGAPDPLAALDEELKLPPQLKWKTKTILKQARSFSAAKLREAFSSYADLESAMRSVPEELKRTYLERWIIDFCR
ncbi:MAG: DNA polymerase III subunit delta [Actinomycetia bacterium]|nr:DNA polymerase III subunit delta [Actinomycetes bacterium]